MPSKSDAQRKFIFAKRSQYKTKSNTPSKWKWIWNDEWKRIEEDSNIVDKFLYDIIEFDKQYIENGLQKCYLGMFKGLEIYTVNGGYIKNKHWGDIDFVEGGNGYAYNFIPENEIWIDSDLDQSDWKYIICHEFIERWFMVNKNMSYEQAHQIANRYEQKMRKIY